MSIDLYICPIVNEIITETCIQDPYLNHERYIQTAKHSRYHTTFASEIEEDILNEPMTQSMPRTFHNCFVLHSLGSNRPRTSFTSSPACCVVGVI